jgi:hypothetical protein
MAIQYGDIEPLEGESPENTLRLTKNDHWLNAVTNPEEYQLVIEVKELVMPWLLQIRTIYTEAGGSLESAVNNEFNPNWEELNARLAEDMQEIRQEISSPQN